MNEEILALVQQARSLTKGNKELNQILDQIVSALAAETEVKTELPPSPEEMLRSQELGL